MSLTDMSELETAIKKGEGGGGVHVLNNALHVYKCTELKVWGILLPLEKFSKVDTLKLPHRTQSFTKAFT